MIIVAMMKLAEVHGMVPPSGRQTAKHEDTQSYWQEVVSDCREEIVHLSKDQCEPNLILNC